MEKSTPGFRYVSVINEHGFLQTEKMRGKKKRRDDGKRETNLLNTLRASSMVYWNIRAIFQLKAELMSSLKLQIIMKLREKSIRGKLTII